MSFKKNMSQLSEGYHGSCPSTTKESNSSNPRSGPVKQEDLKRSYEVFRNQTTAVEVVVKTVKNKRDPPNWNMSDPPKLLEEKQFMKNNTQEELTTRCMKTIIDELNRQLEVSIRMELEQQSELASLRIENEKLKSQLENEAGLVTKLKKELSHIRRSIKMILKGIAGMPQIAESLGYSSDPEYEDFSRELKKDFQVNNMAKLNFLLEGSGLIADSTAFSKDTNITTIAEN